MNGDHFLAQMDRQHVYILPGGVDTLGEAVKHDIIPLDRLEALAHKSGLTIEYPPGADGWATTRLGSDRFAAWFAVAAGEVSAS